MHRKAASPLLSLDAQRQLASMLLTGLSCSSHSLTAGTRDPYYLNFDRILSDAQHSDQVVNWLADLIGQFRNEVEVDQLAFVDNAVRGPTGLVSCRASIAKATGLSTVIVRPYKRLHASQIAGSLSPGDRLLFLCDVLTTGQTLARAAAICTRRHASVLKAIYVYDRQYHGAESLEAIGVPVERLTDRDNFLLLAEADDHQRAALGATIPLAAQDLFGLLASQL